MRWRRLTVAALVVALVASLGGHQLARPPGEQGSDGGTPNILAWLADKARGLVGARPGTPEPEPISAGLAVEQQAPAGVVWPAQKRVKELVERRTANGRFFQLADGRVQAEIHPGPVNYRDADGNYHPIDTQIRALDRPGFPKGNLTNTFSSLFGNESDRLVRVEQAGRHIGLGLTSDTAVTPSVEGATVTYADALNGADLVYEVNGSALKESIVLSQPPASAAAYTFVLRTAGLVPNQHPDGSIAFLRPGAAAPDFVMPAPFMVDSSDDPSSPHGKAYSDQVTQRIGYANGMTTVTISADAGWLLDPARRYPVVIDPTIKIQPVPADGQDVQIYSGFRPATTATATSSRWAPTAPTCCGRWCSSR